MLALISDQIGGQLGAIVSEQTWWFVARVGGIAALVLTALSVGWGLFLSSKIWDGRPTAAWLNALHRWFSALTVVFTGIHIGGLVLDDYVHFGLTDILIPGASEWKTIPVALGVISFHLLLIVWGSSLAMKRIPRRWWKRIHLSSYAMFWLGLVHGVTAGTDAGHPAAIAVWASTTLGVAYLTLYRALTARPRRPSAIRSAPSHS